METNFRLTNSAEIIDKFTKVFINGYFEDCVREIKEKTLLTDVYVDEMGSNKVKNENELCSEMRTANEIVRKYFALGPYKK